MLLYDVLLLIGALAIGHCIFLCFLLLRLSRKLANQLLSFLLLFLSIRIGACIAGLLYTDFQFMGAFIGGVAMAVIGPLFYFYQLSLWNPSFKLKPRDYFHFAPPALALGSILVITEQTIFFQFFISMFLMVVYVISGFLQLRAGGSSKRADDIRWKWSLYFNSGIAAITVLFIGQLFFFQPYVYMAVVVTSAMASYGLSLWAVRHVRLFMREPSKRNRKKLKIMALGRRIEEVIKQEKLYTDPLITVSRLARQLNEPAYLVSLAVNEYFKKSFPEILNELRIKKAQKLLVDYNKRQHTIEAIAYESGFSTLSAFYTVFKKFTFKTPSEYRKLKASEGSGAADKVTNYSSRHL